MIFSYPLALDAPVGVLPSRLLWKKTRMVGLPDVVKTLRMCITKQNTNMRQTDRRTDKRADILPRHRPRYAFASRGKNIRQMWLTHAASVVCRLACRTRRRTRSCAKTITSAVQDHAISIMTSGPWTAVLAITDDSSCQFWASVRRTLSTLDNGS